MYGPIPSEPIFTTAFHHTTHFGIEASQVSTAASLQETSPGAALPEAHCRVTPKPASTKRFCQATGASSTHIRESWAWFQWSQQAGWVACQAALYLID